MADAVDNFSDLTGEEAGELLAALRREREAIIARRTGGGAARDPDLVGAVNSDAAYILAKHGVSLEPGDLAKLRQTSAAEFLDDVEVLAKGKRKAQTQAALKREYDKDLAATIKQYGRGSEAVLRLIGEFRRRGLEDV